MSDTVLNNSMVNFPARPDTHWLQIIRHIAKAQAEITWKAQEKEYEEGINQLALLSQQRYKDGKKAGIRKVVEWIWNYAVITGRDADSHYDLRQVAFNYSLWQAFLEENGLLIKIGESYYTEEELADLHNAAGDDIIG